MVKNERGFWRSPGGIEERESRGGWYDNDRGNDDRDRRRRRRIDDVIIHPGKAKYRITKGESQIFGAKTAVVFEFQY